MKNLFKNTFRNLSKSKITLVSLSFLVFLAIGIFTLLSSTTKNITNTYDDISKKGNLHDFTVSEQYSLGNTDYAVYSIDGTNPSGGTDNDNEFYGLSSDNKIVPWIHLSDDGSRTWQSCFLPDLCSPQDALYKVWSTYSNIDLSNFPQLKQLLFPQTFVQKDNSHANKITYVNSTSADHVSSLSYASIMNEIDEQYAIDGAVINKTNKEAGDDLYIYVQSNNTPMQNLLDDEKVNYRKFSSIDINQSPDNIYYKNVQSNPEDAIDKMVLFNYKNKSAGENLFSTYDFNPNNVWDDEYIKKSYTSLDAILKNPLPDGDHIPTDHNSKEFKEALAKFKILAYGVSTNDVNFNKLANVADDESFDSTEYKKYITLQSSQIIIDAGYKVSIEWGGIVPSNDTITDWTSIFVVVSPEYVKEKNLSVFNYKNYFDVNSRQELISKFNSKDSQYTHDKLLNIAATNPSNTVTVGGGLPYIILGVGITPDFIYPIVNIANPNPNPSKQCILYSNSSGFNRTYDSFKTCPSERYLVCEFNTTNVDQRNSLLKHYNDEAATMMNFPNGTRAAYMYNDTSDFLNASAFRIAYIPQLVEKIKLIDYILTISILLLSLFVASIVISNYIQKQRKILGVMRANGIRKREIAFSLLPFALLPTIAGGIVGYLLGLFTQLPFLTLFKNYWMIPTDTVAFAPTTFAISILIPFILFTLVAWVTVYLTLRVNTVELMKQGSEYKVNIVQKYVKKPFRHFNILTRFRVSIAFNSITKIIILFATTTITMTALIFATSNSGKFNEAKNNTFNSRNYSYAVDLYTPTLESGQYIPTSAGYYGDAGMLQSPEGTNFLPGSYYLSNSGSTTVDTGYATVFNNQQEQNDITKQNYFVASGETLPNLDSTIFGNNQNAHQNLILPMSGDSSGQVADLQYLKNKFLDRNSMDMTVGLPGSSTNPWNIALSLMPENQSNLISDKEQFLVNCAGWKYKAYDIYEFSGEQILSPYVSRNPDGTPNWASDDWLLSNGQCKFSSWKEDYMQLPILNKAIEDGLDDIREVPYDSLEQLLDGFTFHLDNQTDGIPFGVAPGFVNFNIAMNTDLMLPLTSNKIPFDYQTTTDTGKFYFKDINRDVNINTSATDYLYYVGYGTVPLADDDETYTYISVTHKNTSDTAKITGIKTNSKFVNLVDDKGKNINNLLSLNNNSFSNNIIINKYAAAKYGYKVGQTISFNIDNKTDRIHNQLFQVDKDNSFTFKVAGICTSANDEEYFINQECANQILGLKNSLTDYNDLQPHSYFQKFNDPNGLGATTSKNIVVAAAMTGTSLASSAKTYWGVNNRSSITDNNTTPSLTDDSIKSDLVDLSSLPSSNVNVTPNGFNGVFTKHSNGSEILNNRMPLYSPSGLYPASSVISNDTMDTLLRYGNNLQIASQMLGLYDARDTDTEAGKLGLAIYNNWHDNFAVKSVNDRLKVVDAKNTSYDPSYNNTLNTLIPAFISLLNEYYGNSAYTSMITNAIDRDSAGIIFNNLSSTINEIESVIISILVIMVLLIIVLISLMIINDSKGLAATMKALGYRDHQNITSFVSIYVPVILLSVIASIPLGWGAISLFNLVILNGTKIYLTSHLTLSNTIISLLCSLVAFVLSAGLGYLALKNERLVERLKQ